MHHSITRYAPLAALLVLIAAPNLARAQQQPSDVAPPTQNGLCYAVSATLVQCGQRPSAASMPLVLVPIYQPVTAPQQLRPQTHLRGASSGMLIAGAVSLPVGLLVALVGTFMNICFFCESTNPGDPFIVGGLTLAASGLVALIVGAAIRTDRSGGDSRASRRVRPGLVFAQGGAIGSLSLVF